MWRNHAARILVPALGAAAGAVVTVVLMQRPPVRVPSKSIATSTPTAIRSDGPKDAQRILIQTDWIPLDSTHTYEIRRQGDRYVEQMGREIPAHAVQRLLAAIDRHRITCFSPDVLGIDQRWLDAHSVVAWDERDSSPGKRELFIRTFRTFDSSRRVLEDLYSDPWRWSDDYPSISVIVEGSDSLRIAAASHAQQPFMIPWYITRNGRTDTTFDRRISLAVADLLPVDSHLHDRLAGRGLLFWLTMRTTSNLSSKFDMIEAEERLSNQLRELGPKYIIRYSRVGYYGTPDLHIRAGEDWHAMLQRSDLPSYVRIDVTLPVKGRRIPLLRSFTAHVDRYLELALGVPWLKEQMESHPDHQLLVRLIDSTSLGYEGAENIGSRLEEAGETRLFRSIRSQLPRSAWITIAEPHDAYSRWLVLPDRRMVLVYFGKATVMKDLARGMVVAPDGTVLAKGSTRGLED